MNGVVSNFLFEKVENYFGLEVWVALLQVTDQVGLYLSTAGYPTEPIFALVSYNREDSGMTHDVDACRLHLKVA